MITDAVDVPVGHSELVLSAMKATYWAPSIA
jgi:hypothetical protein